MAKPEKIQLTREQQIQLESLDEQIDWIESEIARAQIVGIDVTELKASFEEARRVRQALLNEYGRQ